MSREDELLEINKQILFELKQQNKLSKKNEVVSHNISLIVFLFTIIQIVIALFSFLLNIFPPKGTAINWIIFGLFVGSCGVFAYMVNKEIRK